MNFTNLINSVAGGVHLAAAVLAMISGTWVLLRPKGTRRHRQMGYVYLVAMMVMNGTAFLIYHLFGRFGIFHWLAIVSMLTLLLGMYPVITKKSRNYILTHFNFMYWSVIGLYAAFMAETFVRLPKIVLTPTGEPMVVFYKMVGWAVAVVMFLGTSFYIKNRSKWAEEFGKNSARQ